MLDLRKPLSLPLTQLFGKLQEVFRSGSVPYLLTGGNARQILLVNVYGCEPGRMTTDLDVGLLVPGWEQFEKLKESMVSSGSFMKTGVQHRMAYVDTNGGQLHVDLIPFGNVAGEDGFLRWPPDHSTKMLVLGFQEALKSAIQIRVSPSATLPIASMEGLAILKLVAWIDNGQARDGKDAVDLYELLTNHERVLGDALYDEHSDILARYDFDMSLAASHILGQQVSGYLSQALRALFRTHLASQKRDSLVSYMLHGQAADWDDIDRLLIAFEKGMSL